MAAADHGLPSSPLARGTGRKGRATVTHGRAYVPAPRCPASLPRTAPECSRHGSMAAARTLRTGTGAAVRGGRRLVAPSVGRWRLRRVRGNVLPASTRGRRGAPEVTCPAASAGRWGGRVPAAAPPTRRCGVPWRAAPTHAAASARLARTHWPPGRRGRERARVPARACASGWQTGLRERLKGDRVSPTGWARWVAVGARPAGSAEAPGETARQCGRAPRFTPLRLHKAGADR